MAVEFKRGKSLLEGGETGFAACPLCDPLLNSVLAEKEGRMRHAAMSRSRGRRRGRGGRK